MTPQAKPLASWSDILNPQTFALVDAAVRREPPFREPSSLSRREVFEAVPLIEDALTASASPDTPDEVVARIFAGQAQLWLAPSAALVTEITDQPAGRTVHAWLAAGDLETIGELGDQAEAYGRTLGCTRAIINGRPGWGGFTRRRGYRPTRVVLEKAL